MLIRRRPSNLRIRQLEEENARLRQEAETLRLLEQRQIGEEQTHVDMPSSKDPMRSEILSPKESDTSTPLLRNQGRNSTSNDLEAGESREVNFNRPSSAIFDEQYPATKEATAASQADASIKTQLLAEAARQRKSLFIALMPARIVPH